VILVEALLEFIVWVIDCAMVLCCPERIEPRRASLLDSSRAERRARRWRLALGCLTMLVIVGLALAVYAALT